MGLINSGYLCRPAEYAFLSEVILLGVSNNCAVYYIAVAPWKQIVNFLLCKVIYKHTAGAVSHLSIRFYLQARVVEIKLT